MVSTGGFKQTALMLMPCARLRRPCPLQDAQPARQRRARYSNRCNVPLTEKKKKKKKVLSALYSHVTQITRRFPLHCRFLSFGK